MPVRFTIQYPDSGLLEGEKLILKGLEDDIKSNIFNWAKWEYKTCVKYSWHVQQNGERRIASLVCNWTQEKIFERDISDLVMSSPRDQEQLITGITRERNHILTQSSCSQEDTESPDA